MQRQRKRRREEERHGHHVRRVVVEVEILVAGVRHPIEVTEDPVGKSVSPGAHQHRPDHDQRNVSEDREAERDRHMNADAELSADLHFAQRPGDKGADGADRDDLPQAAFFQRRERRGRISGRAERC